MLVDPRSQCILGVHIFGTGATELVHIGQAVMGCGGSLDFLANSVFNYPTFAEAYKVAALDASNRLRELEYSSEIAENAAQG
jgi:NAD(P) transhydrogenase